MPALMPPFFVWNRPSRRFQLSVQRNVQEYPLYKPGLPLPEGDEKLCYVSGDGNLFFQE